MVITVVYCVTARCQLIGLFTVTDFTHGSPDVQLATNFKKNEW